MPGSVLGTRNERRQRAHLSEARAEREAKRWRPCFYRGGVGREAQAHGLGRQRRKALAQATELRSANAGKELVPVDAVPDHEVGARGLQQTRRTKTSRSDLKQGGIPTLTLCFVGECAWREQLSALNPNHAKIVGGEECAPRCRGREGRPPPKPPEKPPPRTAPKPPLGRLPRARVTRGRPGARWQWPRRCPAHTRRGWQRAHQRETRAHTRRQ
jgi:hypothetical protein